jgi:O-antigen/teichoic acid export membrane protein
MMILSSLTNIWSSNKASHNILRTFLAQTAILGVSLVTGVLTARYLGPVGRGQLAAVNMWPQLMISISLMSIPSSLIYHIKISRDQAQLSRILGGAISVGLVVGVLTSLAGYALMPKILFRYGPEVVRLAQLVVLAVPVIGIWYILMSVMRTQDNIRRFNLSCLAISSLALLSLAALALTGRLTVASAAFSYVFAHVPVVGFGLFWLWKTYSPVVQFRSDEVRSFGSYSLRFWGMEIADTLGHFMDKIFIIGILAEYQLGIYAVALSITSAVGAISTALLIVLFPRVAGRSIAEVSQLVCRAARINFSIYMVVLIPFILLMPFLINVLYGKAFEEGILLVRLFLFDAMMQGTVGILCQAYFAVGRPGVVSWMRAIRLVLMVCLLWQLVPAFGLLGVCWASLIISFLSMAFMFISYPILLKQSIPSLIATKGDMRYLYEAFKTLLKVDSGDEVE